MTEVNFYSAYRTILFLSEDRKTSQLSRISVTLRENFKDNISTYEPETLMLADLLYSAVGKRSTYATRLDGKFAKEIDDCFANAAGFPKENFEPMTREMLTGEVTLQKEQRKVKYRVACSRRFNGSTPKMYMPSFWIEIPSITDTRAPGDK